VNIFLPGKISRGVSRSPSSDILTPVGRLGSGCLILSPARNAGERTEERGNQQKRASSPRPPSIGWRGEVRDLETAGQDQEWI